MTETDLRGNDGNAEAAAYESGLTVDTLDVALNNSGLPYYAITACQADGTGSDTLPQNSLTFFNGNCPDGWGFWEPGVGRFLVPAVDDTNRPIVGDPLSAGVGVVPQHSHPTGTATVYLKGGIDILRSTGGSKKFMNYDPPPRVGPFSAKAAASDVPYVYANICYKTKAPDNPNQNLPIEMNIFNTTTSCPEGWSSQSVSGEARGRYLVGGPLDAPSGRSYGGPFGGPPLTVDDEGNGEVRTHPHFVAGTVTLPSTYIIAATQSGLDEVLPGSAQVIGSVAADPAQPVSPANSAANTPYAMATFCVYGG